MRVKLSTIAEYRLSLNMNYCKDTIIRKSAIQILFKLTLILIKNSFLLMNVVLAGCCFSSVFGFIKKIFWM